MMDSTWGRGWFSGWNLERPRNPISRIKQEIKGKPTYKVKKMKATRRPKKETQSRVKHKPMTHNGVKREGVKIEPKREMKTEPEQGNMKWGDHQDTRVARKVKKEEP